MSGRTEKRTRAKTTALAARLDADALERGDVSHPEWMIAPVSVICRQCGRTACQLLRSVGAGYFFLTPTRRFWHEINLDDNRVDPGQTGTVTLLPCKCAEPRTVYVSRLRAAIAEADQLGRHVRIRV